IRNGPGGAAAFVVRRLDRIGEALAEILAVQLHAVHDDLKDRRGRERSRIHVVEADGTAVDEESGEPLPPKVRDRPRDGAAVRTLGLRPLDRLTVAPREVEGQRVGDDRLAGSALAVTLPETGLSLVTHLRQLVDLGCVAAGYGLVDDRQIESDQEAC